MGTGASYAKKEQTTADIHLSRNKKGLINTDMFTEKVHTVDNLQQELQIWILNTYSHIFTYVKTEL